MIEFTDEERILKKYSFIDLFCGIGGFHCALKSLGATCVFASDINKKACAVYTENFNLVPKGDITRIKCNEIPNHDILCAGFPCQPFSISGNKKGFDDENGKLFFEIIRIARYHKPRLILLENVRNLEAHNDGKTLQTIKQKLNSIGYYVYVSVLNSSDYAVPQARKRLYIVAFRKDLKIKEFSFPNKADHFKCLEDILDESVDSKYYISREDIVVEDDAAVKRSPNLIRIGSIGPGRQGERIYSIKGQAVTLSSQGGGPGGKTGIYKIGNKIRILTPRECARLMGFPDSFVLCGSDFDSYTQLGNSVVVNVLQMIAVQAAKKFRRQTAMNEINVLKFQVAFGAVRHFGRNLYSTNPPAVAELVANAWDAYANKCQIYIKNNALLLVDNGIGMTDDEFQSRYATSGNEKNTAIRKPTRMKVRPYMGKKGIGKFSAFSLADKYELFTKSIEDSEWKHIILEQDILKATVPTYDVPITRLKDIREIKELFGVADIDLDTGTLIYLPSLKRAATTNTVSALVKLLSHRFSITTIMNDGDFKVSIIFEGNIVDIDLKNHFYYNDIEYLHYFGYSKEEIKKLFPNLDDNHLIFEEPFSSPAKGWIGSVSIPSSLEVDDNTALKGICIYINGKLVDEDILKSVKKDRMSDTYTIGEIDADYLGQLAEDVVLSSREGLFLDNESVTSIKEYLENIRKNLVANWDDMRKNRPIDKKDYFNVLLSQPANKKLYEGLKPASKDRFDGYAQKLFDRPKAVEDPKLEKLNNVLFSALIQIVNNEDIQELLQQSKIGTEDILKCFAEIFDLSEINHALRLRDSVRNNLAVISELEKYIETGEVEKVFEKHLAKNPWLIEPTWMTKGKSVHTQKYYELLNIDNNDTQRLYTDIIVEVTDELYPVVVEIKREKATSYSTPNVNDICTQIYNYQKAIAEDLVKHGYNVGANDIKAYFICGKKAFDKLDSNDRSRLKQNKIELRSYDELIRTSKRIFEVNYGEDLENV